MRRFTKQVAEGWQNIRSYVLAELEAVESSQFRCRREGEEDESGNDLTPDPDTCPCEGCAALRAAFAALDWVDQQVAKRRR